MSSAEVVFWLALFGIDIGVPMMLPERFRFRVGAILVSLSTLALFWSLGYRPSISRNLGPLAFIVAVVVAGCASLVARIVRERDLESTLFVLADSINNYADAITEKYQSVALLPAQTIKWRNIVDTYNRQYGRAAARLVRELSNPSYYQFAREVVTRPDSVKRFTDIADILAALVITSSQYRTKRLIKATLQGMAIGAALFVFVLVALSIKSGELQQYLRRFGCLNESAVAILAESARW